MLLANEFNKFIKDKNLIVDGTSTLLAISGGKDSVLMGHLFHENKLHFQIAHCNFQLRGSESDKDEEFVKELAKKWGVACFTKKFNTYEYAKTNKCSIQMAARDLRYQWFHELANNQSIAQIAVAHHQTDSIETILLNLTKGTGIAGLHGILPKRDHIIRPLLFLNRDQIDQIIQTRNIAYREDSSNSSDKYARNLLRLHVLPQLKKINPNLAVTFNQNVEHFIEMEQLLNEQVKLCREKLFSFKGNDIHVAIDHIASLKPQLTLLYELLKPFGFKRDVVKNLLSCLNTQSGKMFVSSTHQIIMNRKELIITPILHLRTEKTTIHQLPCTIIWKKSNIHITDHIQSTHSPNSELVDANIIKLPLTIRAWEEGDFFYPLGMKNKKKVSDFFINQKIPIHVKKQIPFIVNGDHAIIWIMGMRLDNRFKVTNNTKKTIQLTITPI